jgi:hypothetical protein
MDMSDVIIPTEKERDFPRFQVSAPPSEIIDMKEFANEYFYGNRSLMIREAVKALRKKLSKTPK